MDSTPGFECNSLQVLVLDEADRCLDMGFATTMDAIIANLPTERQTLLFSATQSKRCVHQLHRALCVRRLTVLDCGDSIAGSVTWLV